MSALWRELAQIKTSGPIPQASDSISWGWGPGIGVSDEPLGDADAGGLGGSWSSSEALSAVLGSCT